MNPVEIEEAISALAEQPLDPVEDQAIHNKIAFFIRGIKANLGSRSHFTPGSRTHSADPKKSEFPRWR